MNTTHTPVPPAATDMVAADKVVAVALNSEQGFRDKIPKELLLNEKDMAAYLGISRYFLTELRKKHGLKCLIFEGQHCIYYYLPVVDEYFRNRSRSLQPDIQAPETDTEETPGKTVITPVQADKQAGRNTSAAPTKKFPYKPMKAV